MLFAKEWNGLCVSKGCLVSCSERSHPPSQPVVRRVLAQSRFGCSLCSGAVGGGALCLTVPSVSHFQLWLGALCRDVGPWISPWLCAMSSLECERGLFPAADRCGAMRAVLSSRARLVPRRAPAFIVLHICTWLCVGSAVGIQLLNRDETGCLWLLQQFTKSLYEPMEWFSEDLRVQSGLARPCEMYEFDSIQLNRWTGNS